MKSGKKKTKSTLWYSQQSKIWHLQSDIYEIVFESDIFYIILFWGCQSWKVWSHPIKKKLIQIYNFDKEMNATWLKSIFKWIYVEFAVRTVAFDGFYPKSNIYLSSVSPKKYSNDFPTHSSKMSANINLAFGKFLRHLLIYFDSLSTCDAAGTCLD